jgi:hypothetical protein
MLLCALVQVWLLIYMCLRDYFCFLPLRFLKSLFLRFLNIVLRHLVGFLGRRVGTSQGLYLHITGQRRKSRENIVHTRNGLRAHDPGIQPVKTAVDHVSALIGIYMTTVSRKSISECYPKSRHLPATPVRCITNTCKVGFWDEFNSTINYDNIQV